MVITYGGKTTTSVVKPKTYSVRSVDVGKGGVERVGGYTISTRNGGGGSGEIISVVGGITQEQAQAVEQARANELANRLLTEKQLEAERIELGRLADIKRMKIETEKQYNLRLAQVGKQIQKSSQFDVVGYRKEKERIVTGQYPYLEWRQVSSFKDKQERDVPVRRAYYVDPLTKEEREATPEEFQQLRKGTRILVASTEKAPKGVKKFFGGVGTGIESFKSREYKLFGKPIESVSQKVGGLFGQKDIPSLLGKGAEMSISPIKTGIRALAPISIPIQIRSIKLEKAEKEFVGGYVEGTSRDIIKYPLTNVGIYGAGFIVGGGIQTTKQALKLGSPNIITKGLKVGAGIGIGIFEAKNLYAQVKTQPSIRAKGEVIGITTKELFLFGAGTRAGTKAFTITETRTPLREPKLYGVEKQQVVINTKGEGKLYSEYMIRGETRPPTLITRSSPIYKGYFGDVINQRTLPGRKFTIGTIVPVPAGTKEPFNIFYKVGRGAKGKIISIKGISQNIELGGISKPFNRIEKFLATRIVETSSMRSIKPNEIITRGSLGTKTYDIIFTKTGTSISQRLGKSINQYQTLSRTRFAGNVRGNEFYRSEVFFKETTKPFARATGRTPKLPLAIIQYGEPKVLEGGKGGLEYIRTTGSIKTPFSSTFKSQPSTQITSQASIQSLLSIGKSKALPKFLPKGIGTFSLLSKIKSAQTQIFFPASASSLASSTKMLSGQKERLILITGQKNIPSMIEKEKTKLSSAQITSQISRQTQQERIIPKQPLINIIPFLPRIRTPPVRPKPKESPTFIPPFSFSSKQIGKPFGTFSVSIKQGKKFSIIGGGLTLGKAIGLGTQRTVKTSADVFKIIPESKGFLTEGFRTPKGFKRKAGGIFVETKPIKFNKLKI